MAYWRMQLHPSESTGSTRHCVNSLAAGYIGLGFSADVGDLMTVAKSTLPELQQDYWAFAHQMKPNDLVLIIAHHFPFALVTITGEYNYIRTPVQELGVWFRHFRAVKNVRYYADFKTNVKKWEQITMTDTISPLHTTGSLSYALIDAWSKAP